MRTIEHDRNHLALSERLTGSLDHPDDALANEILVSGKIYGALSGEKPEADRITLDLEGKAERQTAFILR